jgi:hypothetical protein
MDGAVAEVTPLPRFPCSADSRLSMLHAPTGMVHPTGDILLPIFREVRLVMRRVAAFFILIFAASFALAAPPAAPVSWRAKVAETMPLLGHRNWILIVDSAYPLQSSPGVETIETNAGMIDVVQSVLATINHSIHVRPDIYMDVELPFVPDQDAPGASAYRTQIAKVLHDYTVESMLHDKIIAEIGQTGSQFHVLVLKTNLTIPYTSVFIRLDCKYWSADAEKRLRDKMSEAAPSEAR